MKDLTDSAKLIKKYNEGKCTAEEKELVESWYLRESISDTEELEPVNFDQAKKEIWHKIAEQRPIAVRKLFPTPYKVAAAAALLLLGSTITFYFNKTDKPQVLAQVIKPGANKAILTLFDGKKILLTDASKGEITAQSGVRAAINAAGQLIYNAEQASNTENGNGYNTIETPAGGQYQLILSDGTKVWLNAASKLRYPGKFTGGDRKVELTGEAYFEVAHKAENPFKVVSGKQILTVMGTHFNVNAYTDEPAIKTTLLEGSVSINNGNKRSKTLKPGEQSVVNDLGINVQSADVDQHIAWHNGDMAFDGASLGEIMRQISRWYDVEIVYQGKIEEVEFGGSISRSKSIQDVLKVLESTQSVKFKLEGRRVIVMP